MRSLPLLLTLPALALATQNSFAGVDTFKALPLPAPHDAAVPPSSLVWPPPRFLAATGAPSKALDASFKITPTISGAAGLTATQSGLLGDIVARYTAIIAGKLSEAKAVPADGSGVNKIGSSGALREFIIEIDASNTTSDVISMETRYGYSITADAASEGVVRGTAESIFGAQYALESFVQLLDAHGRLAHGSIELRDAPMYVWRGLMLDAGRRFFPVPLVENLLDTMAAAKLNVRHRRREEKKRDEKETRNPCVPTSRCPCGVPSLT